METYSLVVYPSTSRGRSRAPSAPGARRRRARTSCPSRRSRSFSAGRWGPRPRARARGHYRRVRRRGAGDLPPGGVRDLYRWGLRTGASRRRLRELLEAIRGLREQGPSEDALERAKQSVVGKWRTTVRTDDGLAVTLAQGWVDRIPFEEALGYPAKAAAADADAVGVLPGTISHRTCCTWPFRAHRFHWLGQGARHGDSRARRRIRSS